MDLDLGWRDLHGAALSGPCLDGLAYSKMDLSLLQRSLVCISREARKHGRLHIFQHQSTGYLRTSGQKALYETCAACALSTFLCYI